MGDSTSALDWARLLADAGAGALVLDHDGRVLFIDRYVGNDEAATLFTAVDGVVLPYRSASQSGVAQLAFAYGITVSPSEWAFAIAALKSASLPKAGSGGRKSGSFMSWPPGW